MNDFNRITAGVMFHMEQLPGTDIIVRPRSGMTSVRARWKDGCLNVTCPKGIKHNALIKALEQMAPRLRARKPAPLYRSEMTIALDQLEITLRRHTIPEGKITMTGSRNKPVISVAQSLDIENENIQQLISKLIKRAAANVAADILLPLASATAAELGIKANSWSISHGAVTLGYCTPGGSIALSSNVVLLPTELRRYIICHELAHLRHMNHSEAFHELCNRYCNGREKELIRLLKTYRWPIMR